MAHLISVKVPPEMRIGAGSGSSPFRVAIVFGGLRPLISDLILSRHEFLGHAGHHLDHGNCVQLDYMPRNTIANGTRIG